MRILPGVVGTRCVLKGRPRSERVSCELRLPLLLIAEEHFFSPITSTLQKEIFHPATTVIFQEPKEGRLFNQLKACDKN